MGVLQGLNIFFTNGKGVFTAKEHVSGEVSIVLAEPMKVKVVELTLRGHAKVTKSGNLQKPGEQEKTKLGQTVNEYLNTKLQLTAGSSTNLPKGETRLPFSFLLPEGLPTSFESRHARIRYWLEAVIVRTGWFKSKRRTFQGLTVIDHVDVNQPELLSPVQETRDHSIGFLCKRSFSTIATLHRKGYCPGETIPINLELSNGTKKPIQSQMAMIQQIEYKVKSRKYSDTQQISAMDLGVMPKGQKQLTANYFMQVPAIAPSITSCNIITVSYVLQFTVGIVGSKKEKITFNCPFTVGTIPFRPGQSQPPQQLGGFTVDIPSPMSWPGDGVNAPSHKGQMGPPPTYPGGVAAPAPSAPPISEYESRPVMFPPSASVAAIPLHDAPDLPEFHRCASDSRLRPGPFPSAPLPSVSMLSANQGPPVAPRPEYPSASQPNTPVRLIPARAAPKGKPNKRRGSEPVLPSTPPMNVSPNLHIFQDASEGSNIAHAYAECIFGEEGGGNGGGRLNRGAEGTGDDWDDDDDDNNSENYHYVPIYSWAMTTPPPSSAR